MRGVSFSTGAQIMHTADCKPFSGELLGFSGNLKRPCFHTKTGAFAMLFALPYRRGLQALLDGSLCGTG